NPFFLEELVLHLAGPADSDLPDTLHALLAARIDALPVAHKRVLQRAAVVGRVFWEQPVRRALGGEPARSELLDLERRGILAGRYPEIVTLARRELADLPHARSRLEQADILRRAAVTLISVRAGFAEGLEFAQRSRRLAAGTNPHQIMHATWAVLAALYPLGR